MKILFKASEKVKKLSKLQQNLSQIYFLFFYKENRVHTLFCEHKSHKIKEKKTKKNKKTGIFILYKLLNISGL